MNNKNILLILIVIILLLIIVIGATFYMIYSRTTSPGEVTARVDKNAVMYYFDEPFISNVKDSRRILKVALNIELGSNKITKLVEAREPEIRNEINLILRSKNEKDLEGSEGQIKLQKQILDSIKEIIKTERIVNIYFNEFVVQ